MFFGKRKQQYKGIWNLVKVAAYKTWKVWDSSWRKKIHVVPEMCLFLLKSYLYRETVCIYKWCFVCQAFSYTRLMSRRRECFNIFIYSLYFLYMYKADNNFDFSLLYGYYILRTRNFQDIFVLSLRFSQLFCQYFTPY